MMIVRRKKNRGIKLGRRLIRVFKWVIRRRPKSSKYSIREPQKAPSLALSKLFKWGKSIRRGLFKPANSAYMRVGHDPDCDSNPGQVPKGHLAVYVGERDGEIQRVLVPVLFLNHPLFGKLLEEAEEIYGFNHPGQITIPCPLSEFENVQTNIAGGDKFRYRIHRQSYITGIKCL